MATIRELNQKIRSLGNMQKVMGAMNMISTIKLQKLIGRQDALKQFDKALQTMVSQARLACPDTAHPLLDSQRAVKLVHIVVFSADKGLCGSHNNAVLKALDQLIGTNRTGAVGTELTCVGIKALDYAKRMNYRITNSIASNDRTMDHTILRGLAEQLLRRVLNNDVQEVWVVYNRFVSTLQQETVSRCLLPLDKQTPVKAVSRRHPETVFEPEGMAFLEQAAQMFLDYQLETALLHSTLSEHASRMTAMENATNNTQDLMDRYGLMRNRARQATITGELGEIIAGKEALEG